MDPSTSKLFWMKALGSFVRLVSSFEPCASLAEEGVVEITLKKSPSKVKEGDKWWPYVVQGGPETNVKVPHNGTFSLL